MRIGILALQGDFIEHAKILTGLGIQVVEVRLPEHLIGLDGLIIPGGESTTIAKLATEFGLLEPLSDFGIRKPVWGTCAGMIFLSKDIGREQPTLKLMDIAVDRNAFGRQADSFETELKVEGLEGEPFHAVFIRAPVVTGVEQTAGVEILSRLADGRVVAVRQGHLLATAFHPELTSDSRLHEFFARIVAEHQDKQATHSSS
jgi:5'-phosphate synthase pdxT subunit